MKRLIFLLAVTFCLRLPAADLPANIRQDFLKIIQRPLVPLTPQVEVKPAVNGLVEEHFTFASDSAQRVPGILIRSADLAGRHPVVIVMHGTGGRKEEQRDWLRELAAKGFVAVAIDGRYHGERSQAGHGTGDYEAAIVSAWHGSGQHPFYYDTVWDVMRLVDYLQTRPDVDAARIGLAGISKGGIETYLAGAADPRFAVVVPFIGMQSFGWALANNDWQGRIGTIQGAFDTIAKSEGVTNADSAFVQRFYDRLIPGIYSEFDGPQMIRLIAPRPLLIVNSDRDIHTPLPGVEECVQAARQDYDALQAGDHLQVIIQRNSGHEVKPESKQAMVDWFVKWLKPEIQN